MSGQSWKQTVEDLAGVEPPLTLAYRFSGGNKNTDSSITLRTAEKRKKKPDGTFFERKLHGAFLE